MSGIEGQALCGGVGGGKIEPSVNARLAQGHGPVVV